MNFNRKHWYYLLVFCIPLMFLLPGIGSYPYFSGSETSDLEISHLPNTVLVQSSLKDYGQIPLWNPYILSGYPLDGDPLSGLWYPPGWIALLFRQPLGLNLTLLLHILLGGLGLLQYLRTKAYPSKIPWIVTGMWMLMPATYAHLGAGHVTYLYAFCLTPWLLYASSMIGKQRYWWEALILAGMILADARWVPYALLAWVTSEFTLPQRKSEIEITCKGKAAFRFLGVIMAALGLSAIFLLPFSEFTASSTRAELTTADRMLYSLPISGLLGIFFPTSNGSAEWVVYAGSGTLLFAMLSLFSDQRQQVRPWVVLGAICLIWSLGEAIPGLYILANLPGLNLLRIPARAMELGDLVGILLAGEGMAWVATRPTQAKWKKARLVSFALGVFYLMFTIVSLTVVGGRAGYIQVSAEVFIAIWILLEFWRGRDVQIRWIPWVIVALLFCDLLLADGYFLQTMPRKGLLPERVIEILNQNPAVRIYSPSYSVPQDLALEQGWKLSEGIHPLQLKSYVDFFSQSSGVSSQGYSVVQPPLATGNPSEDNKDAIPDLEKLKRLNVGWIVASYPIRGITATPIYTDSKIYVYRLMKESAYPRKVTGNGKIEQVTVVVDTPNRIVYHTEGESGILETADVDYPGWVALENGEPIKITSQEGVFRSIQVEAGEHTIEFVFRPVRLYAGMLVSAGMLFLWIVTFRRVKNE